jgi:hypothetical protein
MSKAIVLQPAFNGRVTETAIDAVAVTASDATADPNGPFWGLYVGVAGNITLTTLAGSTVLLTAVPIGILKVGCTRVWSTGTGAAATLIGLK